MKCYEADWALGKPVSESGVPEAAVVNGVRWTALQFKQLVGATKDPQAVSRKAVEHTFAVKLLLRESGCKQAV